MKTIINGFNVMEDFNALIKEVRELGCGGYYIPRGDFCEYVFVTNRLTAPVWHVLPIVCASDCWSPQDDTSREILERLKVLEESRIYRKMPNFLVVKFERAYRAYDWLALTLNRYEITPEKGIKWRHELVLRECEGRI